MHKTYRKTDSDIQMLTLLTIQKRKHGGVWRNKERQKRMSDGKSLQVEIFKMNILFGEAGDGTKLCITINSLKTGLSVFYSKEEEEETSFQLHLHQRLVNLFR